MPTGRQTDGNGSPGFSGSQLIINAEPVFQIVAIL